MYTYFNLLLNWNLDQSIGNSLIGVWTCWRMSPPHPQPPHRILVVGEPIFWFIALIGCCVGIVSWIDQWRQAVKENRFRVTLKLNGGSMEMLSICVCVCAVVHWCDSFNGLDGETKSYNLFGLKSLLGSSAYWSGDPTLLPSHHAPGDVHLDTVAAWHSASSWSTMILFFFYDHSGHSVVI